MTSINKFLFWILGVALILTNVYVFIHSINSSNKINFYEQQIKTLHTENIKLENKVFGLDSLRYAASMAAKLNFNQEAQPVFLDNLIYARSQ